MCWALLRLCIDLADVRQMLPPYVPAELVDDVWLQRAAAVLARGRELARRLPGLAGRVELLRADIAHRIGAADVAAAAVAAARADLAAHRDARGAAAAAVVAGDLQVAPFASPVTWGLSLAPASGVHLGLVQGLENAQQRPVAGWTGADEYAEAARLYESVGDARGMAVTTWRRSYLALVTGRPDLALDRARAAAAELSACGDAGSAVLAGAHACLAGIADGSLPDPLDAAAPVLEWATGAGSLSTAIGIATMLGRAGRLWNRTDRRPERALAALAVSEAISTGLGRPSATAQTLVDVAEVLVAAGARDRAISTLHGVLDATPSAEPADSLDPARQRTVLVAAMLHGLAVQAEDAASADRAEEVATAAVAALRSPDPAWSPIRAATAAQLSGLADELGDGIPGLLLRAQEARDAGDVPVATRLFDEASAAVAADPSEDAGWLHAVVLGYRLRFDEAAARHRRWLAGRLAAVTAARQAAATPVDRTLALQEERELRDQAVFLAVRLRDPDTARTQLAALQALADPWWRDLGPEWQHHEVVGSLLELEGDLDAAAAAFGRAVEAAEAARAELRRDDLRQAFGADRAVQRLYRGGARVALLRRRAGRGDALDAVRLMDAARSRALADLMTGTGSGLAPESVARWREAVAGEALARDRLAAAIAAPEPDARRVAARRADAEAAQRGVRAREAALRAADPRFWQLASPGAPVPDPAGVVRLLPPGHAVLMYSYDRPELVACGLTATGVVATHVARDERRLDRLSRALVTACSTGGRWEDAAADLGTLLLEPLGAALADVHTVHIIGSGELQRIPFALLPWQGRALGAHVALTVLPSLGALPSLSAVATGPALSVGDPAAMTHRADPDGPPRPVPALPAARVEAVAVTRVTGGTALIGSSATHAHVRDALADARILHLATHGVIDPESPLASAVLLADGARLTVAELAGSLVRAELVVLSACQTGTGQAGTGDELLGLGRAVLAAGARSAVVTLWPVQDICTALVMTWFHEARELGLPTARALQQATNRLAAMSPEQVDAAYRRLHETVLGGAGAPPEPDRIRAVGTSPPVVTRAGHPRQWAAYVLIGR